MPSFLQIYLRTFGRNYWVVTSSCATSMQYIIEVKFPNSFMSVLGKKVWLIFNYFVPHIEASSPKLSVIWPVNHLGEFYSDIRKCNVVKSALPIWTLRLPLKLASGAILLEQDMGVHLYGSHNQLISTCDGIYRKLIPHMQHSFLLP